MVGIETVGIENAFAENHSPCLPFIYQPHSVENLMFGFDKSGRYTYFPVGIQMLGINLIGIEPVFLHPCSMPGIPEFENSGFPNIGAKLRFWGIPCGKPGENPGSKSRVLKHEFWLFVRNSPIFSRKRNEIRVNIIIQCNYVLSISDITPCIIITLHTLFILYHLLWIIN